MLADFHIHLATLADATQIAEMSKANIEYGLPWGWTPSRVARAIIDPETNVAVIRERNILAAFGIMKYEDEVADLHLLAVHPSRRGLGLGGGLLAWLEQVASTAGIVRVRLEARTDNTIGRAFYRSHGYREIAQVLGMYQGTVDGVRLEKRLYHYQTLE